MGIDIPGGHDHITNPLYVNQLQNKKTFLISASVRNLAHLILICMLYFVDLIN